MAELAGSDAPALESTTGRSHAPCRRSGKAANVPTQGHRHDLCVHLYETLE